MRIKGMEGGLSLKNVKMPKKYNQLAREEQNRIKIQQKAQKLGRAEEEEMPPPATRSPCFRAMS